MRKKHVSIVLALMAVLLAGCTTTIRMEVLKPAEVNMSGARRIAVMDFDYPQQGVVLYSFSEIFKRALLKVYGLSGSPRETVEERIARYVTDRLIITLLNTGYFEIINPGDLNRALSGVVNTDLSPIQLGTRVKAQAIIVGNIHTMESEDLVEQEPYTITDEKTGKEITQVRHYQVRTAKLALTYRVVNTRSGEVMATKQLSNTARDKVLAGDPDLKEPDELYQEIVDSLLPAIPRQIAPYKVVEYRVLMKDEEDDPRMERADGLVKGNLYDRALESFLAIWDDSRNVAAGFNAAIMYEVLGNTDSAIATMDEVLDVSTDRQVTREYQRLLRVQKDQEELRRQFEEG